MTSIIDYLDIAPAPSPGDLEAAFRRVAARYAGMDTASGRADLALRTVEATVYDGAYGPAGLVLAINGSPPRGTFLVPREALEESDWCAIVYLGMGQRVKTLSGYRNGGDYRVVTAYARAVWATRMRRTA